MHEAEQPLVELARNQNLDLTGGIDYVTDVLRFHPLLLGRTSLIKNKVRPEKAETIESGRLDHVGRAALRGGRLRLAAEHLR